MNNEKNKTKYQSIRVSNSAKNLVDEKLTRINNNPLYDKVSYSLYVEYLTKKLTPEDEKELLRLALTWDTEEKRLNALFAIIKLFIRYFSFRDGVRYFAIF